MDHWLMVLMNNVLMMFVEYFLVVLMDHILVVFFYNRLINVSLDLGCFHVCLHQSLANMGLDSRFLIMTNNSGALLEALLNDGFIDGLYISSFTE